MRYLEFACASNFSFLRGASHPEELMLQAASIGLSGLGLCDRNSVAGVVRAHLAKREQNLKLRYHPGARLVFADGTPDVLAYPRDRAGWGRLCRLLTAGNLRAEKGECILRLDDLLAHAEGLELVVASFTSPRLRGEVGSRSDPGEGANPQAQYRGNAPSPARLRHSASKTRVNALIAPTGDLPLAGGGKKKGKPPLHARESNQPPSPDFLPALACDEVSSGSPSFSLASIFGRSSGSGLRSRACDHWNRASR